ncbi:MAG: hypothetical protein RIQ93_828 [Verrucomicrobiota bacterium]|jgi:hypothetical protein
MAATPPTMLTHPRLFLALALPLTSLAAQPPAAGRGPTASSREAEALAQPFVGITTAGKPQPGLFPVRATGVSTEPVRQAALAFLAALSPAQRAKTTFPVDDPEWRKWMNVHRYARQGVSFQEMTAEQRTAAFGLMRASLSAQGLKLSQDIMKLNHTLGELNNNNFTEYGEWLYHLTVMGEPSADKPWGWQMDGHHLIINYFVLGDQVVMSPAFYGSEPVIARAGKYQGVSILQDEQNRGLKFLQGLSAAQRKKAVLEVSKTGNNNLTEAFKDNVVLDYAGLPAAELEPRRRAELLELIELYVNNMDEGHARVKMDDVRAQLDKTHFAWIGGDDPDAVFYYRIHSPVVLIEFDHQRPANTRHLRKDPLLPIRDHIHVVVRTPNGNDYGKDLLRQHHEQHRH